MLNLYQEILMDHYKNPRNRDHLNNPSFSAELRNSSCGDEIKCAGIINDSALVCVQFEGKGCVISQATASLLSEKIITLSLDEISLLDKDYLLAMLAIPVGPVRMQCALLSLRALEKGISEYKAQKE